MRTVIKRIRGRPVDPPISNVVVLAEIHASYSIVNDGPRTYLANAGINRQDRDDLQKCLDNGKVKTT